MDLWDQKRAAGKGIFFVMQQGREIRVQHTQTIAGVVGQGRSEQLGDSAFPCLPLATVTIADRLITVTVT
jgi:hypothetical protein